jgi:hypothetical protein
MHFGEPQSGIDHYVTAPQGDEAASAIHPPSFARLECERGDDKAEVRPLERRDPT